jgi:hypothetical protein
MKNRKSKVDLSVRIYEGLKVSFQRLLEEKRKNNGLLVFSENGKIIKLSAKQFESHKKNSIKKI